MATKRTRIMTGEEASRVLGLIWEVLRGWPCRGIMVGPNEYQIEADESVIETLERNDWV